MEAERFLQQFKQIDFQVPFDNLKREKVTVGGVTTFKDLYLAERLLPTLAQGMVALSRQLEEMMNHPQAIDIEVRQRFNPCLFLGQYLMRHNHNLTPSSQLSLLLTDYAKVEHINRYFIHRFQSFYKLFSKSIGKDKKSCDVSQLKLFLRDLDHLLNCQGTLKTALSSNKNLLKNKQDIKFNEILEELAKFIVSKTTLTDEDFEKLFHQP